MKVCLFGPPFATELDGTATSRVDIVRRVQEPPLGILSLASLLEGIGIEPQVFDINALFCNTAEAAHTESRDTFFDTASARIADIEADVFGFGTISGSYPLTVRLAAAAKNSHPGALIIFGGPQATALDIETLGAFPFVDFIVRGEADETFPRLLEMLDSSRSPTTLPGITYRGSGGAIRTADARVVTDLDHLPIPAFHLWHGVEVCRYLSIESGRGCPFCCTFCSTSAFFGRQYRMKSPSRIIGQMKQIQQDFGVDTFHLVHDTFTAHRDIVVAFCEALLNSGGPFKWTCSARTDCMDLELLELMKKAGCTGIFFGIETGSVRLQHAIGKRLDLDHGLKALRCADSLRVNCTVSLITGFPDETPEDLRSTVNLLIDALCFDRITGQLHLLTAAAGSPLHNQYRGDLVWDGIFSELMVQNWRQDVVDYSLIRQHPEVFPDYYAIPTLFLGRYYLVELRDFVLYGAARFRWLVIALHQHSGDLLKVFELWRSWCAQHRSAKRRDTEYYGSEAFHEDFLEFVSAAYLTEGDPDALAITTILEYEIVLHRTDDRKDRAAIVPATDSKPLTHIRAVPRLVPGVVLVRLSADYQGIIECLKNRKSLRHVPRQSTVVACRQSADNSAEVLQLSPLSAALLQLCDGKRSATEIAEIFPRLHDGLDKLPKEKACIFALNELIRQGFVMAAESPGG